MAEPGSMSEALSAAVTETVERVLSEHNGMLSGGFICFVSYTRITPAGEVLRYWAAAEDPRSDLEKAVGLHAMQGGYLDARMAEAMSGVCDWSYDEDDES